MGWVVAEAARRTGGRFVLPAQARSEHDVLATYCLVAPRGVDVVPLAQRFAVGQSLGTWVEVPGATDEMRRLYEGRVASIVAVPAADLTYQLPDEVSYLIQIAIPVANLGSDLAQLITTFLGNDASTSIRAKLVDLELPPELVDACGGPRFGTAGIRELTGVFDRPLVLNMIKPCTGLSPDAGAAVFYETALGGPDMIKDDELLGSTDFSPLVERVTAFTRAAERAAEVTGRQTLYIPNVTAQGTVLLDNARRAVDAGARAVMVAYGSVGLGMLAELSRTVGVPVLGHYAGSGMWSEGARSGMTAGLAAGFFPRLCGADLAVVNTPYGGYSMTRSSYLEVVNRLSLPMDGLRPTMPVVGGGVHAGVVELYLSELGPDVVLAPGGGVQGHPDGPAAGVRSILWAIEAWQANIPTDEYAAGFPELAAALAAFGYRKEGGI